MDKEISLDTTRIDKILDRVKDMGLRVKIFKQISKIIQNPKIGKPMKNIRKGTREVYINPFRLSYSYKNKKIIFLDLYHKDEQ